MVRVSQNLGHKRKRPGNKRQNAGNKKSACKTLMTGQGDNQYDAQYDAQHDAPYEPPCKTVLRSIVACESCGKRVTVHTLRYRHLCVPTVTRLQRATAEAQQAVQDRAQATVQEENASRYAHFFMR